jgi:hypothetical protein
MTLTRSSYSDSQVSIRKYLFLLPLFIIAAFFIYLPVLTHFFVSDDFQVLYRVCKERVIFIPGFFRPLSDITIYANYVISGLHSIWFNSFNILIHGINSFLVFLICLRFADKFRGKSNAIYFALLSSVFFISYPFHNEAIVWILGRGAGMACLFALLGLLSYYEIKRTSLKMLVCSLCYFISIAAFESTMIFPLIVLLLLFFERQNFETIRKWTFSFALTFLIHLIFRLLLSGSILGSYGNGFFHTNLKEYCLHFAKTAGRLILPPSDNALLLVSVFIFLIIIIIIYIKRSLHRIKEKKIRRNILVLSGMLVIASMVPFVGGISTQTSESDRLMYFPSVFACMIWALVIVYDVRKKNLQRVFIFLTIVYNLIFLELNNLNWEKASSITSSILEKISESKNADDTSRIYFLNIPEEIEGAYVFRKGFSDALKLYGFDTTRFIGVNYLSRSEIRKIGGDEILKNEISLPPEIEMKKTSAGNYEIFSQDKLKFISQAGDKIYYWNTRQMELFRPSSNSVP